MLYITQDKSKAHLSCVVHKKKRQMRTHRAPCMFNPIQKKLNQTSWMDRSCHRHQRRHIYCESTAIDKKVLEKKKLFAVQTTRFCFRSSFVFHTVFSLLFIFYFYFTLYDFLFPGRRQRFLVLFGCASRIVVFSFFRYDSVWLLPAVATDSGSSVSVASRSAMKDKALQFCIWSFSFCCSSIVSNGFTAEGFQTF